MDLPFLLPLTPCRALFLHLINTAHFFISHAPYSEIAHFFVECSGRPTLIDLACFLDYSIYYMSVRNDQSDWINPNDIRELINPDGVREPIDPNTIRDVIIERIDQDIAKYTYTLHSKLEPAIYTSIYIPILFGAYMVLIYKESGNSYDCILETIHSCMLDIRDKICGACALEEGLEYELFPLNACGVPDPFLHVIISNDELLSSVPELVEEFTDLIFIAPKT